ncbi:MAG: hypothetical protein N2V78_07680, partial [Methanophagales archaeon]|nr:hypothetical protein [Methanophagales archaeon]
TIGYIYDPALSNVHQLIAELDNSTHTFVTLKRASIHRKSRWVHLLHINKYTRRSDICLFSKNYFAI